jgi:hypothetical protein
MKIVVSTLINSKIIRSVVAAGAALWWWSLYEESRIIERSYRIPCCFYPAESSRIAQAPEMIRVLLRGTRRSLRTIDPESLALHIDVTSLLPGTHALPVDETTLFLPQTIKLINWSPAHSMIVIS